MLTERAQEMLPVLTRTSGVKIFVKETPSLARVISIAQAKPISEGPNQILIMMTKDKPADSVAAL